MEISTIQDNVGVKDFATTAACPSFSYLAEEEQILSDDAVNDRNIFDEVKDNQQKQVSVGILL